MSPLTGRRSPAGRPQAKKLGDQCFYGSTRKQGKTTSSPLASTPSSDRLIIIGLFVVVEILVLYAGFHSTYRRRLNNSSFSSSAASPSPGPCGDDVILLVAYASQTENQDAIDMGVVQTLGDSAKACAGITLLDFKPFNPADWLGSSTLTMFGHKYVSLCVIEATGQAFLVITLDLLSGLMQGLDMELQPLIAASNPNLLSLLAVCLKHPQVPVRQSSPFISASNNTARSVGEVALRYGRQPRALHSLHENAAVSIGQIGLMHLGLVAVHLPEFAQVWCLTLYEIRDNEEKDSAFRGFCTGESAGDCQEPAVVLQRSCAAEPAVARAERDVHNTAAGLQAAQPRWVDVAIQERLATHYGV
ncbi:hypothetical protein C8J57DRAFT_1729811 [Mycena rebaudengoi]|nr:hypothetical protein C8J57DRAFT_1729811 [Mycena rebaudengoi]